jgi:hypothetical protein
MKVRKKPVKRVVDYASHGSCPYIFFALIAIGPSSGRVVVSIPTFGLYLGIEDLASRDRGFFAGISPTIENYPRVPINEAEITESHGIDVHNIIIRKRPVHDGTGRDCLYIHCHSVTWS